MFALAVIAVVLAGAAGQDLDEGSGDVQGPTLPQPPRPECSSCGRDTSIVCSNNGFAYPNLCFALCAGVNLADIAECPASLIAEVSAAETAAQEFCQNHTCGSDCAADVDHDCGWDSNSNSCVTAEETTPEELNSGKCPDPVDECNIYTCGIDCQTDPSCGWSSVAQACVTGGVTTDNELGLGDCLAGSDFDMCESFRPCLNDGVCNSTGDYQFDCTCTPGFTGMVCEEMLVQGNGTNPQVSGGSSSGSSSDPIDDDPFGGIFIGGSITAANAMVISIGVLIVSVVVSATVLYVRRARLRRENVTFSGLVDGTMVPVKRRFEYTTDVMHDLEFDNSAITGNMSTSARPINVVSARSNRPGPVYTISPVDGQRTDEYTEVDGISPRGITFANGAMSPEEKMLTCTQCRDQAPAANGCIDQDDNKWYCNSCWRGLDDANAEFV